MNERLETSGVLDRLDRLSPWAFTGTLYLARWVVVLPVSYFAGWLGSSGRLTFNADPVVSLFGFLLLAPVLETLLECALPYWIMRKLRWIPAGKRPWAFVAVSAALMALLLLEAWPVALLPSLVTGGFLAYTYLHFAPIGFGVGLLHTVVFHAGINLVGWFLLFVFH